MEERILSERLKKYRGQAAKIMKEAEQLLSNGSVNVDLDLAEEVLEKLETFYSEIEKLGARLIHTIKEADIERELEIQRRIDSELPNAIASMKSLARRIVRENEKQQEKEGKKKEKGSASEVEKMRLELEEKRLEHEKERLELEKQDAERRHKREDEKKSVIKLPELQLKKFDSNIMNWRPFYETFRRVVHENDAIPGSRKMEYLYNHTTGMAQELVGSMDFTEENYKHMWEELVRRFGNDQATISEHYKALANIASPRNDMKSLRNFYDNVLKHALSLRALGSSPDHPMTITNLTAKIPFHLMSQFEKENKGKEWTVEKLLEKLREHVEALEKTDRLSTSFPEKNRKENENTGNLNNRNKGNFSSFSRPPWFQSSSNNSGFGRTPPVTTGSALSVAGRGASRGSGGVFGRGLGRGQGNGRQWSNSNGGSNNQGNFNAGRGGLSSPIPPSACRFCGRNGHWSNECRTYPDIESRKFQLGRGCWQCLKDDHTKRECRSTKPCFHCKEMGHNQALCSKIYPQTATNKRQGSVHVNSDAGQGQEEEEEEGGREIAAASITKIQKGKVKGGAENQTPIRNRKIFPLSALTKARNETSGEEVTVRVLLDSADWRTFISTETMKQLKLKVHGTENLEMNVFGGGQPLQSKSPLVKLQLGLENGEYKEIWADVLPTITAPYTKHVIENAKVESLAKKLKLTEPLVEESVPAKVDILIGLDYYHELIEPERLQVEEGLYLQSSKFGWMLSGSVQGEQSVKGGNSMLAIGGEKDNKNNRVLCLLAGEKVKAEEVNLERFWDIESIGIKESPYTSDDEIAQQKVVDSIKINEEGRYEVEWPKKEGESQGIPVNYGQAVGRLRSLLKKFEKQPEMMNQFQETIDEQLNNGVIEEVTKDTKSGPIVHYIPSHSVTTPQKTTTKFRMVLDARVLNEFLYRGPILLPEICGMILRFRLPKIAILSDLEKAYLQISVKESDRDLTRWLWVRDRNKLSVVNNLVTYRVARVGFGVVSSPFILQTVVKHHLEKQNSETAKQIARNVYVDNILAQCETVEKGEVFYKEAKEIFKGAKMNLREWYTNSPELRKKFATEDRGEGHETTMLGIQWDTDKDEIYIKGGEKVSENVATKRQLLQNLAVIFDPLGLYAPITLKAKLIIQKLWENSKGWDEKIEEGLIREWTRIAQELKQLSTISLQRGLGISSCEEKAIKNNLVCFVDASPQAYAAVVYLRTEFKDQTKVDFVMAKDRLAPLKKKDLRKNEKMREISIPRLELMAMEIGTRCLGLVERELDLAIENKIVFSDSEIALHWLTTKKQLKVFVANRVEKIKSAGGIEFQYVATGDNPADLATKPKADVKDLTSELWLHGPKWLKESQENWPKGNVSKITPEVLNEINKKVRPNNLITLPNMEEEGVKNKNPLGMDFRKLKIPLTKKNILHVTAYVLRFVNKLRKQSTNKGRVLTVEEIQEAEKVWIKKSQECNFKEIFKSLEKGERNQMVMQLGIYKDKDGILRSEGRIKNSSLPRDTKFPKLLPPEDQFTELLVRDAHEKLAHAGVAQTLVKMRREYWVPKGRRVIRKVINNCSTCRRYEGGPYIIPTIPSLPETRVRENEAFTHTGLDYFGPLYIKESDENGRNWTSKVWIALFTCMTVRAIHLEVVRDLSTEQFLLALRRFFAIRGVPKEILSDNQPSFKVADKVLQQMWNDTIQSEKLQSYVVEQGVKWRFLPENAPWMGGFYERMVGEVKRAMRKSLGRNSVNLEQLRTLLPEISAIINSRPLMYVGAEWEGGVALTPANFLTLNAKLGLPPLEEIDENDPDYKYGKQSTEENLLDSWKRGQRHLEKFWQMWQAEYLMNLRERGMCGLKQPKIKVHIKPKINQVVLIKEKFLPRGSWRLGRIEKLITSVDGNVRAVQLQYSNGRRTRCPIALLHPLEVSMDQETNPRDEGNSSTEEGRRNSKAKDEQPTGEANKSSRTRGRFNQRGVGAY